MEIALSLFQSKNKSLQFRWILKEHQLKQNISEC